MPTLHRFVEMVIKFDPFGHHRVAVWQTHEVVVLETVFILPDQIAVPVDFLQRGLVAT